MIIQTHFDVQISTQVLFIESLIENCNDNYFIPLIEEGIKNQDNCNYWTNVKGQMTSFTYFNKNETFCKLLAKTIRNLNIPFINLQLVEAWGFKCRPGEYTAEHNHMFDYSGIFYLNDTDATIDFPQINKSVKCLKNKFVFFSGIMLHGTKRLVKDTKYGIAFNLTNNIKK